MARVTYKYIQDLDMDAVKKMSKSQVADLLRKTREKTKMRLEQLDKAKTVFSPAKKNFEDNYREKSVNRMTKNEMIHEFAQHQQFHKAKTSTVKGAREVANQQDIMIFGKSKKNPAMPAHRMKASQREKFWAVYEEFFKTYKDAYARFRYQAVWEQLGEMHVKGKIKTAESINTDDLEELLRRLEEQEGEELEEYDELSPNVYSGRRST